MLDCARHSRTSLEDDPRTDQLEDGFGLARVPGNFGKLQASVPKEKVLWLTGASPLSLPSSGVRFHRGRQPLCIVSASFSSRQLKARDSRRFVSKVLAAVCCGILCVRRSLSSTPSGKVARIGVVVANDVAELHAFY